MGRVRRGHDLGRPFDGLGYVALVQGHCVVRSEHVDVYFILHVAQLSVCLYCRSKKLNGTCSSIHNYFAITCHQHILPHPPLSSPLPSTIHNKSVILTPSFPLFVFSLPLLRTFTYLSFPAVQRLEHPHQASKPPTSCYCGVPCKYTTRPRRREGLATRITCRGGTGPWD